MLTRLQGPLGKWLRGVWRMDALGKDERRPVWFPCGISMGQGNFTGGGGEVRSWEGRVE